MVAFTNSIPKKLLAARMAAAQLRSEAFSERRSTVLGFVLRPITLRSHNELLAEGNLFMAPQLEVRGSDVASFIWIHSAAYDPEDVAARVRILKRVYRRLFPLGYQLNDWLRRRFGASRLVRAATRESANQRLAAATAAIRALVREAMADFPKADGRPGEDQDEPLPFARNASILNLMHRRLGLSFSEAESMPLKRLVQHLREVLHFESRGKAMLMTEAEAGLLAEDLRVKTELASSPAGLAAAAAEIQANAERRTKELGLNA